MKLSLTNAQADALARYLRNPDDELGTDDLLAFQKALEHAIDRSKASGFLTIDEIALVIRVLTDWVQDTYMSLATVDPVQAKALQDGMNDWNTIRLSVLGKLATIQSRLVAQAQNGRQAAGGGPMITEGRGDGADGPEGLQSSPGSTDHAGLGRRGPGRHLGLDEPLTESRRLTDFRHRKSDTLKGRD